MLKLPRLHGCMSRQACKPQTYITLFNLTIAHLLVKQYVPLGDLDHHLDFATCEAAAAAATAGRLLRL